MQFETGKPIHTIIFENGNEIHFDIETENAFKAWGSRSGRWSSNQPNVEEIITEDAEYELINSQVNQTDLGIAKAE